MRALIPRAAVAMLGGVLCGGAALHGVQPGPTAMAHLRAAPLFLVPAEDSSSVSPAEYAAAEFRQLSGFASVVTSPDVLNRVNAQIAKASAAVTTEPTEPAPLLTADQLHVVVSPATRQLTLHVRSSTPAHAATAVQLLAAATRDHIGLRQTAARHALIQQLDRHILALDTLRVDALTRSDSRVAAQHQREHHVRAFALYSADLVAVDAMVHTATQLQTTMDSAAIAAALQQRMRTTGLVATDLQDRRSLPEVLHHLSATQAFLVQRSAYHREQAESFLPSQRQLQAEATTDRQLAVIDARWIRLSDQRDALTHAAALPRLPLTVLPSIQTSYAGKTPLWMWLLCMFGGLGTSLSLWTLTSHLQFPRFYSAAPAVVGHAAALYTRMVDTVSRHLTALVVIAEHPSRHHEC